MTIVLCALCGEPVEDCAGHVRIVPNDPADAERAKHLERLMNDPEMMARIAEHIRNTATHGPDPKDWPS